MRELREKVNNALRLRCPGKAYRVNHQRRNFHPNCQLLARTGNEITVTRETPRVLWLPAPIVRTWLGSTVTLRELESFSQTDGDSGQYAVLLCSDAFVKARLNIATAAN